MKITLRTDDAPIADLNGLVLCALSIVKAVESDSAIKFVMAPVCKPEHIHINYSGLYAYADVFNEYEVRLFSFSMNCVNQDDWRILGHIEDLKPKVFAGIMSILNTIRTSVKFKEGNKDEV